MRRAERRCASTGAREPAWGRRGRRGWGLVEVTCGPGGRRQRAAASGALARPAWRGEEVDGVCREAVLVRGATHLRVGFGSRGGQRSRRAAGVVWGTSTCGAGRGGGHYAVGHEPRYAALRLRRGLGRPHGDGFDVRHRQRLEPSDLAGRVLAGDRLDGVDQIRRATFDVCDAWVAGRVEIYAEATVAKGYAMLPNRCADRRANR